ncbi:stage III sporulation protein AD [Candidatus Epulonipiscium fishelsonii]|uniref:Stage III sporulation protein AD n=1 Tax=Candidatus Epulonipiscium fishelsonii TaxID=77094 RepID=A0ACC8X7D4_9FIRM|nr:stage III sporulation protein AD [Epulopiscium sp. SCG-B11WGA-EpuloA1]ONI41338.1 stage III sporulation protein AD [Epulopiscium sp. SCG-B05WGA-EpuloA1]
MNILQIVSFAAIGVVIIKFLAEIGSNTQMYVRIIVGLTLFSVACSQLDVVFQIIQQLANKINMEGTYLTIILKIIGIAYISEFGYQLCKDAGEEGIGGKVQFAAKVMIFVVAAPVILALIDLITQLI